MSIVEPVFAVALGVPVLGESLTAPAVIGTLLILVSAWLALARDRRDLIARA